MPVIKDIFKLVSSHYVSESLSNWQGDIEDIDTEQLVNVLCENQTEVLIKSETINEVNQIGNTCNSPGIQNLKSRQGIYFEESHIARLGHRHQPQHKSNKGSFTAKFS